LQNADSALSIAQENNIDFILAQDKVQQAEADLAITKLTQKPSVVLHGSSGYKNGYVPNVNEIRFNYNAGVTFRVPIYNGGKTKQQERLNESLIRQNQLAVETLNNNYKKDLEQALTDIKTNIERIENTGGQIEQARVAQQLATSRFMNGVGTNLEITNASTNLQRAEFTRLQYEYQLCLAKVQLAKLLGYKYW
jgi:outer membrane protein TolC